MINGTRRGWGVSVTPRPLFTPGKDPVPIVQEAGWAPGPVWTRAENLAPTGIRSPDRPARSQSLYRLRYPAHIVNIQYILEDTSSTKENGRNACQEKTVLSHSVIRVDAVDWGDQNKDGKLLKQKRWFLFSTKILRCVERYIFRRQDDGTTIFRNVCTYFPIDTA